MVKIDERGQRLNDHRVSVRSWSGVFVGGGARNETGRTAVSVFPETVTEPAGAASVWSTGLRRPQAMRDPAPRRPGR
jgi:hypothetical protein